MKQLYLFETANTEMVNAFQNLSSTDKTRISNNNLFYLDIDDSYIHQLFPLIKVENIKNPEYFGEKLVGADITIVYSKESKKINKEDLAQEYNFTLKKLVAAI